jgi:hypothetical protein
LTVDFGEDRGGQSPVLRDVLQRVTTQWIAVALCVVWAATARANHTAFQFFAERFEFHAGAENIVDEFDDGVVAPWTVPFGTVVESDGALILRDPGTHNANIVPLGELLFDRSDAQRPDLLVESADASASAAVTWRQTVPKLNEFFGLAFAFGTGADFIGVGLVNPDIGNAQASGIPPGLQVVWLREAHLAGPNVFSVYELDSVPFDASQVTGDVILRIDFDGVTQEFTGSASLDGGDTTFHTFDATPAITGFNAGSFGLVADPMVAKTVPAIPGPAAIVLAVLLAALGICFSGRRSFGSL